VLTAPLMTNLKIFYEGYNKLAASILRHSRTKRKE
jgi:hypothetical protein